MCAVRALLEEVRHIYNLSISPLAVTVLSSAIAVKPKAPVLVTSGGESVGVCVRQLRDGGIPGILRVATSVAGNDKNGKGNGRGNGNGKTHNARRRGRNHHGKDKEPAPQSPVTRTRLTTEHPDWFEPLLSLPQAKNIVQLYDQLMVLQQRNLILIVSLILSL